MHPYESPFRAMMRLYENPFPLWDAALLRHVNAFRRDVRRTSNDYTRSGVEPWWEDAQPIERRRKWTS